MSCRETFHHVFHNYIEYFKDAHGKYFFFLKYQAYHNKIQCQFVDKHRQCKVIYKCCNTTYNVHLNTDTKINNFLFFTKI